MAAPLRTLALIGVALLAQRPVFSSDHEADFSGWTIAFDDDLLLLTGRDRDYTGGLTFTLSGRRAATWSFGLDRAASWLDPLVPARARATEAQSSTLHALQFGVLAFTPNNLNARRALVGDRPYASVLFITASRSFIADANHAVYDTSLSVAALGLPLAGSAQLALHNVMHAPDKPNGWQHQISDGGEPTLRVGWGRQALLASAADATGHRWDFKWRTDLSAGYLTEGSVALSGRWGRLGTPWWTSGAEHSSYALLAPQTLGDAATAAPELYLSGGVGLRLRAYNALLQGQFRRSEVSYRADALERLIGDAWIGVTWQSSASMRWSYLIQYQTPEIKSGTGHRKLLWAGLVLSYRY